MVKKKKKKELYFQKLSRQVGTLCKYMVKVGVL